MFKKKKQDKLAKLIKAQQEQIKTLDKLNKNMLK